MPKKKEYCAACWCEIKHGDVCWVRLDGAPICTPCFYAQQQAEKPTSPAAA